MALDALANHLWQSTVIAGAIALLALFFRRNRAHVRHALWLAASIKFLVPFAALIAVGRLFSWRTTPVSLPELVLPAGAIAQPFSQVAWQGPLFTAAASPQTAVSLESWLLVLWAIGAGVLSAVWFARWRRIARIVSNGSVIETGREVELLRALERRAGRGQSLTLVSSESSLEPGVFGLLRPLLLWPRGISERLTDQQVKTILAHELSHVRRHDNVSAAVHMLVQATFWFHPLVWWVGARLLEERERACDEDVLRLGSDPAIYAESILRTCEFHIESPLPCVAGVTGADLQRRIEQIMRHDGVRFLTFRHKVLLAVTTLLVVVAPLAAGAFQAGGWSGELSAAPQAPAASPTFEVASIKPNNSGTNFINFGMAPGGRFTANNTTVRELIRFAYTVQPFQMEGGPDWIGSERYDVMAKAPEGMQIGQARLMDGGPLNLMMRALLANRFKLVVESTKKEMPVFELVMARADRRLGPRLKQSDSDCEAMRAAARAGGPPPALAAPPEPGQPPPCGLMIRPGNIAVGGFPIAEFARTLSQNVGRIVIDKTGLQGNYAFTVDYTPEQMPGNGGTPPAGAPSLPPIDPNGPSIYTALQEQLGLKLQQARAPVDMIVIKSIERPTPD